MTTTPHIAWVQQALNDLGLTPPLAITGERDEPTIAAVEAFQRGASNLIVDGKPGPNTQAALEQALAGVRATSSKPPKETKTVTDTAPTAPPVVVSTSGAYAPIFATLEGLKASVSSEALAIYHKFAPWYVRTFLNDKVVTDAVSYAIGSIEGAAAGVLQKVPTVQQIVTAAIQYVELHEPSFLDGITDRVEDLLIAKLQKLGMLPPEFSRASIPQAA